MPIIIIIGIEFHFQYCISCSKREFGQISVTVTVPITKKGPNSILPKLTWLDDVRVCASHKWKTMSCHQWRPKSMRLNFKLFIIWLYTAFLFVLLLLLLFLLYVTIHSITIIIIQCVTQYILSMSMTDVLLALTFSIRSNILCYATNSCWTEEELRYPFQCIKSFCVRAPMNSEHFSIVPNSFFVVVAFSPPHYLSRLHRWSNASYFSTPVSRSEHFIFLFSYINIYLQDLPSDILIESFLSPSDDAINFTFLLNHWIYEMLACITEW